MGSILPQQWYSHGRPSNLAQGGKLMQARTRHHVGVSAQRCRDNGLTHGMQLQTPSTSGRRGMIITGEVQSCSMLTMSILVCKLNKYVYVILLVQASC
jgi:hypothetical protein